MPASKMNKRVASASGSVKALESELLGETLTGNSSMNADAGRDVSTDLTPWQRQALGKQRQLVIRQGWRRRHPDRVLNQFTAVAQGSTNPNEQWEKAMLDDTERTELPEYYKKVKHEGYANQVGLVATAFKNYQASKNKLSSGILIGS